MSFFSRDDKIPKSESANTNQTNVFSSAHSVNTVMTTPQKKKTPRKNNKRRSTRLSPPRAASGSTTGKAILYKLSSVVRNSNSSMMSTDEEMVLANEQKYDSLRPHISPPIVGTSRATRVVGDDSMNDSANDTSASDLSQIEEAIRAYDAKMEAESKSSLPTIPVVVTDQQRQLQSPAKLAKRPASFFSEHEDFDKTNDITQREKKVSVNKLLDIYNEASPSSVQVKRDKQGRDSTQSYKENAYYFHSSSSSSVISSKRKLETKVHHKTPKSPMRDITAEHQHSDESQNTSSSLSNSLKHASTVSTQELLSSLLNEQNQSRHVVHTENQEGENIASLTNILEDETANLEGNSTMTKADVVSFKIPQQVLYNENFNRGRSPPMSVESSSSYGSSSSNNNNNKAKYRDTPKYHQVAIYNAEYHSAIQFTQENLERSPKNKINTGNSSSSSDDSFHSFEDVEYGAVNQLPQKTYSDISEEKLKLTDSYEQFAIDKVFPQRQYHQQQHCSPKTAKLLMIFSVLIPPFYILIAVGALDYKIGKISGTYKLIAGLLSVFSTVLIMMAIGLAFGYGLTHL